MSVLAAMASNKAIAVTSAAVLEEVHFVFFRQTGDAKDCLRFLKDLRSGLGEIYPLTQEVVQTAWKLFSNDKRPLSSVKDYYHVACMLCFGSKEMLSCDDDFDRFSQITRIDPLKQSS